MKAVEITQPEARQLILRCQGLDGTWTLPPGKEGVAQTIQRLMLDLAYSFARQPELGANFLKRVVATILQPVAQA